MLRQYKSINLSLRICVLAKLHCLISDLHFYALTNCYQKSIKCLSLFRVFCVPFLGLFTLFSYQNSLQFGLQFGVCLGRFQFIGDILKPSNRSSHFEFKHCSWLYVVKVHHTDGQIFVGAEIESVVFNVLATTQEV